MPDLLLDNTLSGAHPITVMTPSVIVYEPNFEGWLSAVFYIYKNRLQDDAELQLYSHDDYVPSLIDNAFSVPVNTNHSARVLKTLHKLLGPSGMRHILWGFLSEKKDIGTTLFHVVKYAIAFPNRNVIEDLGDEHVLSLTQTVKSVGREKHRMEAFVRFEHTIDDVYFARIEPDFNVLPIIAPHFCRRYQDQNWAIYDLARGYGVFFDKSSFDKDSVDKKHFDNHKNGAPLPLQTITEVDADTLRDFSRVHSDDEQRYQRFWQGYFYNVNIKARKNPRLHRQYLPQRYWKYLSEKQVLPNAAHVQRRR